MKVSCDLGLYCNGIFVSMAYFYFLLQMLIFFPLEPFPYPKIM